MEEYYKDDLIPSPVSLEEIDEKEENDILKRYMIPGGAAKSEIQKTLFMLGIHEGTLFPEVDHQSTYLQQLWSYSQ